MDGLLVMYALHKACQAQLHLSAIKLHVLPCRPSSRASHCQMLASTCLLPPAFSHLQGLSIWLQP